MKTGAVHSREPTRAAVVSGQPAAAAAVAVAQTLPALPASPTGKTTSQVNNTSKIRR